MNRYKVILTKTSKEEIHDVEYSESHNVRHSQHIASFIGDILDQCVPGQEQDVQFIYDLKEGSYTLDAGEYWLDVEVNAIDR